MPDYVELYWSPTDGDMRIRFLVPEIPLAEVDEAAGQLDRVIEMGKLIRADRAAAVDNAF